MQDVRKIRNVTLLGHAGCGKTSLGESLLFHAGATTRLGRVDDGTSILDFYPEELERKSTFTLSLASFMWEGHWFNLIDPPGFLDFAGDVSSALRAADCSILVIHAGEGVQVGTEVYWDMAFRQGHSLILFVNQMGCENARDRLSEVRETLGDGIVALQVPTGAGVSFEGITEVLKAKEPYSNEILQAREQLLETLSEFSDSFAEKYLEGKEISAEEILKTLKEGVQARKIFPLLYGDALQGKGIKELLSAVIAFFGSPLDISPLKCQDNENLIQVKPDGPLVGLIFKTVSEPHIGEISYIRVFSGELRAGMEVWNASNGTSEKVSQIFSVFGKERKEIPSAPTGGIAALVKLRNTTTGHTLCEKNHPCKLLPVEYPRPSIYEAVVPKTRGDEERFSEALSKLRIEDPSFTFHYNPELKQYLIYGLGEQHLNIIQMKMKKKFNVEVVIQKPKVPYRETIRKTAEAMGKYVRQSGGRGQYGICFLRVRPLARGAGFEFSNDIFGGAIPNTFIPSVETGVRKAIDKGVLAGCPIVDIHVSLFDGKYHPVDSSNIAFEIAGSMGLKAAEEQAEPYLLEPIYTVEVTVPEENMGDIIGDLNARRAKILGMDSRGKTSTVKAQVPLAEMYKYANVLKSITRGRGLYSMEFSHYEEVPRELAIRLIPEIRKERGIDTAVKEE